MMDVISKLLPPWVHIKELDIKLGVAYFNNDEEDLELKISFSNVEELVSLVNRTFNDGRGEPKEIKVWLREGLVLSGKFGGVGDHELFQERTVCVIDKEGGENYIPGSAILRFRGVRDEC